jgi:hypothetical protein
LIINEDYFLATGATVGNYPDQPVATANARKRKRAIGSASKPLQAGARSGLLQLQQNSNLYKQAEYTTAPILQTTLLPIGFLVGTSLKFSLLKVRRYGFLTLGRLSVDLALWIH